MSTEAEADGDPSGVVERIRRSRADFSTTEAAIAEKVLANPQAALMATTSSLAKGTGVSQKGGAPLLVERARPVGVHPF